MMNVNLPNWKCVPRKCNTCTYISLPGVEIDSLKRSTMITFNTHMTRVPCSHHGILIIEKITTYLDAKGTSKSNCSYKKQLLLDVPFAYK